MKIGTWTGRMFSGLMVGLLVLAALVSSARPSFPPSPIDCPLPADVMPPAPPPVTAQEVEDGSASLADFVLVAKDYFVSEAEPITDTEQAAAAYVRCSIGQDGSPWQSGSTYLVRLTPGGRVFNHAQDMSLAGRQLTPVIYGAILHALGIGPDVLTDRAAAQAAFIAAAAGDGGPFNVPGVPGAAGYATVYFRAGSPLPYVMLAGFDLEESHLVPISEEDIDYGDPPITAREVVDRATLEAFVTAAMAYAIELLASGDLDAMSIARMALRDPNGPWRHGPVYLAVMERASRQILFHGAFPDRFELRRGGITRDAATGELIVEQLIAAAESGPEGGFWLYHFDNPADDTDSADIPKVGYARVFAGGHLIINSGFYLTSDSVFVQRILDALEEGQTSIMFGMTAPEDGDVVAGDAVDVTVLGAPTDAVHFAYRPAGSPEAFTYLGAATNREAAASFAWDTLDLPDDDYELVALYTEDDGESVIYDRIEVSVDNLGGGGGGCAAAPLLAGMGGPLDPTLPALVGLLLAWLLVGRPVRRAARA